MSNYCLKMSKLYHRQLTASESPEHYARQIVTVQKLLAAAQEGEA
jgi:hypothetical protein